MAPTRSHTNAIIVTLVPPASHALPTRRNATVSLYQFFAPGGVLSRTHPAYEFRRGQLQMAQAVEQALEEKRHLIVEAGTGTGKTLAYLVPVIRSGKRVIISTGTKNLQEQLFHKDIPFLEQALFPNGEGKLNVCYMKGRNNYLCRKKLYDLDRPARAQRPGGDRALPRHRRLGEGHANRRPGRTGVASRSQRALAQDRRPLRHLPGTEMQRLGPLLHHRNAPQGDGERHHHRQPSLVLCRPFHQAAGRVRARCRNSAGGRGRDFRRSPRTGRRCRKLFRSFGQQWALRGVVPRCGSLAATQPYAVSFALGRAEELARAGAVLLRPVATGRRPFRLRKPARVHGRKRRRVPGIAAVAHPPGFGAGEPAVQAGGSLQLRPARAGVAGAAWIPDGIRRPQHRVLDRAPARRTRQAECFPPGHSHRCGSDPEDLPVRQTGMRGADLGDAGRGRQLRLHAPAARTGARPRSRPAFAFRL